MLRLCRFTNFSLLFVKLPLFSKIKLNSSFFIREKKIFKSFLFCGICKSRLYSLDISTDIPILDSLLVHIYYMMIAYQKSPRMLIQAHVENCELRQFKISLKNYVNLSLTSCKILRSSRPEVLVVKGVLKICSKFRGEHPC